MIPKFRAWDTKEKQLLNIGLIDLKDKIVYMASNKYFMKSYNDRDMQKRNPEWGLFEDLIFMQSTGLKDKYGKEIFAGDVVNFTVITYRNSEYVVTGKVVYKECRWVVTEYDDYDLYDCYANDDELEVLGNIYENPELLEVEE